MRMATKADAHLPAYDNTKLQAINTCPTWGTVRYSLHKVTGEASGRAMPLEMGSAAHELFAAVRLWQLGKYQNHEELFQYHGPRLFGSVRFDSMLAAIGDGDDRAKSLDFCLTALETSGFYDDPRDKRRTYSNLEEACIAYVDRWNWHNRPVWIRDVNDNQSDIGVEIPFDTVLTYEVEVDNKLEQIEMRYIGKADGVHLRDGVVFLHENKTAGRIDDAWQMSFMMSSQITGYMLALSVHTGASITTGEVLGMTVPLPRTMEYGGIVRVPVTRYNQHFKSWFHWFLTTALLGEQFKADPINAPRYTHSCSRYFRPCSLLPFCDSEEEEQKLMLSEMPENEWSPLHEINQGD